MKSYEAETDWFLFYQDQLLLQRVDEHWEIPRGSEPPVAVDRVLEVTGTDEVPGRTAALQEPVLPGEAFKYVGLRASWDLLPLESYLRAGRASQLLYWDAHSQFCPACGTRTVQTTPICKQCPACHYELYPTIATAIIVLIRKGHEVLLVRARNFRGTFHGLVAGFLEVGETLEECVVREVREETGLTIRNIRYFDNQPWPYPSGLMVGFVADYVSGEVHVQEEELTTAAFFRRDALPEIPRKLSMARRLIDWWIAHPEEDPVGVE